MYKKLLMLLVPLMMIGIVHGEVWNPLGEYIITEGGEIPTGHGFTFELKDAYHGTAEEIYYGVSYDTGGASSGNMGLGDVDVNYHTLLGKYLKIHPTVRGDDFVMFSLYLCNASDAECLELDCDDYCYLDTFFSDGNHYSWYPNAKRAHCYDYDATQCDECEDGVCEIEIEEIIHYMAVDDSSPVSDVQLLMDVKDYASATYGEVFKSMLNSEIEQKVLENRMTLFIYQGKALIIIGDKSPSDHVIKGVYVSNYLEDRGIEVIKKMSSEIYYDDLRKAFDDDSCYDSDGGKDYYTKGTTKKGSSNFKDKCYGNELMEFYCDSDQIQNRMMECAGGCSDGKCLNQQPEAPEQPVKHELMFDSGRGKGKSDKMTYLEYKSEIDFIPKHDMKVYQVWPDIYYCNGECYFNARIFNLRDGWKFDYDDMEGDTYSLKGYFDEPVELEAGQKYRIYTKVWTTKSVGIYTAGEESPNKRNNGMYNVIHAASNTANHDDRGPITFQLRGKCEDCSGSDVPDKPDTKIVDLKYYPDLFIDDKEFTAAIVVGDTAPSSDIIAAIDISTRIAEEMEYLDSSGNYVKPSAPMAYLASEIDDPLERDLIVIGNPCNNEIAGVLLGNPAYCEKGFTEGEGIIRLYNYRGHVQMLVAGYSNLDTRKCARVLANYDEYALQGKEVIVYGTSTTYDDITVGPGGHGYEEEMEEVITEPEPYVPDTCYNNVKDNDEVGIDCGGLCKACAPASIPTCDDGLMNDGEEGIDCGGPCKPCKPTIDSCNGCLMDTTCLPFGTRFVKDNSPVYCSIIKDFQDQKAKKEPCQNNYECKTNQCNDGVCGSLTEELRETRGMLQKILDWLAKIF